MARDKGFTVEVVSNAYWATSEENAALWLEPLKRAGLTRLSLSDDEFHHGQERPSPAKKAEAAAKRLGIKTSLFHLELPSVSGSGENARLDSGGLYFRGRAVAKLTPDLPARPWTEFASCPENLSDPGRVHADPYGNVMLCQGLCLGNIRTTSLAQLVAGYAPDKHPIVGPLCSAGPSELAKAFDLPVSDSYVDACHLCYHARSMLLKEFPEILAPEQVYGL